MKKQLCYVALLACMCAQSCWWVNPAEEPNDIGINVSNFEPVIMNRTAFEASTKVELPKSILNAGKIYVKDEFLFINEKNQGFHVFDNSNPESPVNLAFIQALGATDIAIKNNVLYINNATDLISLTTDFNLNTLEITKRVPNAFPQMISPDGFQYNNLNDGDIIVDWILND